MKPEHDDFARRHPSLDRALREQIAAPKMDGAFRQQVFARIAAQRTELARAAASPQAQRSRLRAQLLLQLANIGAMGVATALLIGALWPRLAGLPAATGLAQEWGLPVALTFAGAALFYGLRREFSQAARGLGL
jgi:hypothetical protein